MYNETIMIKNQSHKICGLVGKTLGHSFSPQIHNCLADYSYSLFEIKEEDLEAFIKSDGYHSVNVTIPYKKAVIPYLDEISEIARKIGAVNVVTHLPDGRLYGDNTDFYGFCYMMRRANIDVRGKNVLILGTGGSSRTVSVALECMGAENINFVSRTGEINYENAHILCPDTEIIVNTTPVGMYPNNGVSPIDIEKFPKLCGVADIVYNPRFTQILLDAQRLGIPFTNGLNMLVAQAKCACEIFTGESIDDSENERITGIIENQTVNIVLVGMPGCGKTTIGRLLSEKTGRVIIDTDEMVEKIAGKSIPEIFAEDGEEEFRRIESEAVTQAGKNSGVIISTGGGVVTKERNHLPLHQNGKIFFIERDTDKLSRDGRPLSLSGNLEDMYNIRLPLYVKFCDHRVINITPSDCAKEILEIFENK